MKKVLSVLLAVVLCLAFSTMAFAAEETAAANSEDLDALVMHSDNIFLKQENMSYLIEKGCEIYSHPDNIIYFK